MAKPLTGHHNAFASDRSEGLTKLEYITIGIYARAINLPGADVVGAQVMANASIEAAKILLIELEKHDYRND